MTLAEPALSFEVFDRNNRRLGYREPNEGSEASMSDTAKTLTATVTAARSKLNHQERLRVAMEQRDAGYVALHAAGWTYDEIERRMREGLAAAGLSPAQIAVCGVSHHNIRAAVRATRGNQ